MLLFLLDKHHEWNGYIRWEVYIVKIKKCQDGYAILYAHQKYLRVTGLSVTRGMVNLTNLIISILFTLAGTLDIK